jgi:HTH-type transcriptional regulator/antitoxin HipB
MPGRKCRAEAAVVGRREARALAATLGGDLRSARRRLKLTQAELGERVGLGQSRISEIERGLGGSLPLEDWVSLGIALGRPVAVELTRSVDPSAGLADAGHLELQELAIGLAARNGIHGTFELATRPTDPSRSADVGLCDDRARRLVLEECWNRFGDLGAAVRSSTRKVAEAKDLAIALGGERPYTVHLVWLVRPTAANRGILRRYPTLIRSRFPGSATAWARAVNDGAPPPPEPGIVWFDPATGRAVPIRWRLR